MVTGGPPRSHLFTKAPPVSIRPPHWGRGKTQGPYWNDGQTAGFNPPPALEPGETTRSPSTLCRITCFNPPPALEPGETPPPISSSPPLQGFNPPPPSHPRQTLAPPVSLPLLPY